MESAITQRLHKAVSDHVFPGCFLGIVRRDGARTLYSVGALTYEQDAPRVTQKTVYDVASVTKAIPGSLLLMKMIDEGNVNLTDRVIDIVPEFNTKENKKDVLINHLLTYTLDLDIPSMSTLKEKIADEIIQIILNAPLKHKPGKKYLYVNSTAFIMGCVLEHISGKAIDVFALEELFDPLEMSRTTFHPECFSDDEVAPTEIDRWRGGVVHKHVHDESSFVLSQKSPVVIAGLFSTTSDLLNIQEMFLNGGMWKEKRIFSEKMVEAMYTNQRPEHDESAGLGWKMGGRALIGSEASDETFWKSGFTGCLVCTDPEKGIGFTLLSNRTYPKRSDKNAINEVRKDIANIIFE